VGSARSSCISRFGCSHQTIVLPPPVPRAESIGTATALDVLAATSKTVTPPSEDRANTNRPSSVASGSLDGAKPPGAVATTVVPSTRPISEAAR
jgi:hypothetical protein